MKKSGTLLTLLLFLVFVLCALFTVLIGGRVYENMNVRMEQQFTGNTALHYIANKVRQDDAAGMVRVCQVENVPVLELAQTVNGDRYVTWIYYQDQSICELFAGSDSGLGLDAGIPVMECEGLNFFQEGSLLTIETTGAGGGKLLLALRSEGGLDE